MNKLLTKIVGVVLGTSMAVGVGTAVIAKNSKGISSEVNAAAGDVITFTININNVTAAGATWPTAYSTTQTTWSQTVSGVTMSFAAANFTTGTGGNAGTMQNRTNASGCSYLINTALTPGYAIKSVQGASSTARNWNFYGATSTISVSNANPAVITGGTQVGSTNTNNSEHAFGSGTTYTTTNYQYTHFAMVRTGSNAGYYTSFTVKVVELEQSSKTVTSISVGGSMTKTSYTTAESWDPSGLTVTGVYDNDPTDTVDLTSSATWTYSPETPNSTSVTSVVATAHFSSFTATSSAQAVTVTAAPGTLALPYTVSQAIAAVDAGSGTTGVYTTGIVCGYYNSGFSTTPKLSSGKLSFYFSADGSEGEDGANATRIEAYNCYKAGPSTTFSDVSEVPLIGATIVIYGNLTLYNSTTYEYAANCYLVSVANPSYTVSFNGNGASGSMSDVSDQHGSYTLPDNGFTVPSNKVFIGWKANNSGDLLAVGANYNVTANVTFYAQWADAYTVTYTAGSNGSGSYAHTLQPAGSYTLLPFASLTGVSSSSGYRFKNYTVGGVNKNAGETITLSAATSVTVNFELIPEDTTYVFATNYATYASSWTTTYGSKTVYGTTDVGGNYAATIEFARVNKQSSGVGSDKPYVCPNTNSDELNLVFTLTETGKKIKDVTVTYEQRGSNAPTFKLFKGNSCGGTALDTATIGTKNTLSTTDLNDVSFSISGNAGKSGNVGAGLTSIYISIENQAAYGTTDHITVTSFPNTVYHIGETYDATGLVVMAYDGADEATANFKDVTASVSTQFTSGAYTFDDDDVPTVDMWVEYTDEGNNHYYADDITMHIYALAEYQLVESEPADWSGNYLIVATDGESDLCAMNGALTPIDVEGNHKAATDVSGIIENGQELEFTIASYSTGYSIQGKSGKYIGWASGSSNGLTASDTALVNTLAYSDGGVVISGSGGRQLNFNTDGQGRFRYYASGKVQLYKLVESSEASDYADAFLTALQGGVNPVCDADGETNLATLKTTWKSLADSYALLSAADKEQFRLGVASEDPNATNIAKALALYDYIAAKYNTQLQGEGYVSNYDFMNRNIQPMQNTKILSGITNNNANSTVAIIIISMVSLITLGGYFLLRKRKEER